MRIFIEFDSLEKALAYRKEFGAGGWIFEDTKTGVSVMFPPIMTPTAILTHAMTKGRIGNLIGHHLTEPTPEPNDRKAT